MKRTFKLRDILSVTTGRLLTKGTDQSNGIEDLCDLLSFLTGESLFTHQLPRAKKEATPFLLSEHPELAYPSSRLEELDKWLAKAVDSQTGVTVWLAETMWLCPGLKDEYELEPIPEHGHEQRVPIEELVSMVGPVTAQGPPCVLDISDTAITQPQAFEALIALDPSRSWSTTTYLQYCAKGDPPPTAQRLYASAQPGYDGDIQMFESSSWEAVLKLVKSAKEEAKP